SYYQALKRLTLELAGIRLGEDHRFLVETRLSALARREGFETLPQMIEELFSRGQTRLAIHVVSALLERTSRFFDDRESFEILGDKLLPALHPIYRGGTVKILVYGCSSGQEVYSAAIVADRLAHVFPDMDVRIHGVDYPSLALDQAKQGRFTHFEVQRGLPIRHLVEYFTRDGEDWLVNDSLRRRVDFDEHNLLSALPGDDHYQIVMFRGRQQQYSSPAAVRILREINRITASEGYLMLGTKENLEKINFGYETKSIAPGVYKKRHQNKESAPDTESQEPHPSQAAKTTPKPVFDSSQIAS
ncbi:MAG TPA: hypothetical protein ENJ42_05780, partial [Hellea balneolensis]|nr:hypothetical protein [Hellea balneolensis]